MNTKAHALRTRWAAIGAAVAVTLGAGIGTGVLTINAAPLNDESVVVAVDPVRVVDTRSGVGILTSLASGTDYPLRVTGDVATTGGLAQVVPQFATGVILNVTVVRPTSSGFLSVVPATAGSGPFPTSNLNFLAGANTPNAVTVALPALSDVAPGDIRLGALVFRFDGSSGATADVLVDVVGYLTESVVLDNERRIATLEATSPVGAAYSSNVTTTPLSSQRIVESVTIATPKDGTLIVNSSVQLNQFGGSSGSTSCSITTGTEAVFGRTHSVTAAMNDVTTLSATRGFDVGTADSPVTINLVCFSAATNQIVTDINLTATYVPIDPETFAGG